MRTLHKGNEQGCTLSGVNERGFVFTEVLMALIMVGALLAIAMPNISTVAKRIATKHEMRTVANTLMLYEAENGVLPSSLSSLCPSYFAIGSGYDKDQFGTSYQWTLSQRKLCSTTISYCIILP